MKRTLFYQKFNYLRHTESMKRLKSSKSSLFLLPLSISLNFSFKNLTGLIRPIVCNKNCTSRNETEPFLSTSAISHFARKNLSYMSWCSRSFLFNSSKYLSPKNQFLKIVLDEAQRSSDRPSAYSNENESARDLPKCFLWRSNGAVIWPCWILFTCSRHTSGTKQSKNSLHLL